MALSSTKLTNQLFSKRRFKLICQGGSGRLAVLTHKLLVRFNWDDWMYDSGALELTGELQTLCSVAEPQWHREELLFCMSPGASIKTNVEQRREIKVSSPTLWLWSSKYETEIVKTCNNYLAFSADGKRLMRDEA